MLKGIFFALGACLIWGLIFVIPQFMTGFSAIEVALGRYFLYGLVSSAIFLKGRLNHPRSTWFKALYFSLIATIGYYTAVVLALRYSSPAVCALTLGLSPVTIAFYGNWREREISFKRLILPSLLILSGLTIINIPHLNAGPSLFSYGVGLGFSFFALALWSWYAVANSRFLKENPKVSSSDWSTLIGVSTLLWVILLATLLALFFKLETGKYFTYSKELRNFLIGSAVLGFLSSWVGAFLWNQASVRLPVSLAGQLTIFETIFGALFVYLISQSAPPMVEIVGIAILFAAIFYGIKSFGSLSKA